MSTGPVPASKTNTLIDRLAAVAAAPTLDELEIGRIHREASALIQADAAGAHTVLGAVAALRGDADKARQHHEIALNLNDSVTCWTNYAISLSTLEEHEDALNIACDALKRYPDRLDLLDQAIRSAVESAHFAKAQELCQTRNALAPDHPYPLSATVGLLAAAVKGGVFGEPAVKELMDLVNAIERDATVRPWSSEIRAPGGTSRPFLYERSVRAPAALAAELNERLAERIADHPTLIEDPGLEFVVVFTGVGDDVRNS